MEHHKAAGPGKLTDVPEHRSGGYHHVLEMGT